MGLISRVSSRTYRKKNNNTELLKCLEVDLDRLHVTTHEIETLDLEGTDPMNSTLFESEMTYPMMLLSRKSGKFSINLAKLVTCFCQKIETPEELEGSVL